MKKRMLSIVGGAALAIMTVTAFTQVWVSAQGPDEKDQGLIGSWNLIVTLRNWDTGAIDAVFPAMNTYNQGGTTQQTAVPNPQFRDMPGHGVWRHQNGREYAGAFQFFSINLDGTYAGKVVVRSVISLGQGGDEYSSTDTAEIFAPNGVLIGSGCSTTAATRFR